MKRMLTIGLMIVLSGLWLARSQAQDFDLRQSIVHADDLIQMSCAAEFDGLDNTQFPRVRVIGSWDGNLYFYGFSNPAQVRRIGCVFLPSGSIQDLSVSSGMLSDEGFVDIYIAAVSGSKLYLLRLDSMGNVGPLGVVSGVSASRVWWRFDSDGAIIDMAVGTTDGRVLVYRISAPSTTPSFNTPINLGNPAQVIVLPSNSPVRRVLHVGNSLVVAIGQTIYRYALQSGQYTLAGKEMRLFAPVAEMVASGSYIVAASEDGYVYAFNTTNGQFVGMLKERYSAGLGPYSLCLLPNDRVAVGYRSVRIYNLPNFDQAGEVGIPLVGLPELGNVQLYSLFRPSASHTEPGWSVLPLYSSGVNLPVAAVTNNLPRVAFVTPVPYYRRYAAPASRPPVYAVSGASTSQFASGIAYGYADGVVRIYNMASSSLTPAMANNLERPVFALAYANLNNENWLLVSAGALGELFAWDLDTNTTVAIIPAGSTPRILYGVKVQGVSGSNLVFWTAASDGTLQQWSWSGAGQATSLRNVSAMNAPLWSLDINSSGHIAVAGAAGVRYLVGTTLLSYSDHRRAFSVAFRPGRPSEFAVSAFSLGITPRLYRYVFDNTVANDLRIYPIATLERGYRSSYPYRPVDYSPALLAWVNQNQVAAASIYGGKVRIYDCSSGSLHYLDMPADDRGTWDNSTVDAYEPVRDGVLAFVGVGVNTPLLAVGAASGEGVVWGRSTINWTSFYLGYPLSIDFLRTGQRVYAGRIYNPATNFHIPIAAYYQEVAVLPHSAGDLLVYRRVGADGAWFADLLSYTGSNPLQIERKFDRVVGGVDLGGNPLQDTSPISTTVARLAGSVSGSSWSGVCRIVNLQNIASPTVISSPTITVGWPSDGNRLYLALAPNGTRFALSDYRTSEVRVWTYSGSSWGVAAFNLPVAAGSGYTRALRFVTDNQLLVAYPDGTPRTWRLALYNWNGSAWVQASTPVDTQLTYFDLVDGRANPNSGRLIDVVIVNDVPRVVFSGGDGLAFYKIVNNTLQLVGRATLSSSGFMECMRYGWVRFNLWNPTRVGIASHSGSTTSALELDVSHLSW